MDETKELRRGIATNEAFAEALREKGSPVEYYATAETMRDAFAEIAGEEITFNATDETVSEKVVNKEVEPTEDRIITYTDGASGAVFENEEHTAKDGDVTPAFEGSTEREGYDFTGWNPEVAEIVSGDATYEATWEEHKEPGEDCDIVINVELEEGSDGYDVLLSLNNASYSDYISICDLFESGMESAKVGFGPNAELVASCTHTTEEESDTEYDVLFLDFGGTHGKYKVTLDGSDFTIVVANN